MHFPVLVFLFLSSGYVKAQEERAKLPVLPAELESVINHITPQDVLSDDVYVGSLIPNATEVQMVMQGSVSTLDSENLQVVLENYKTFQYPPQYSWVKAGSKKSYKLSDLVEAYFNGFASVSTDNGNERMIARVGEPGAQSFGTTQCSPRNLGYFICEAVLAVNEEGQVQQYTEFEVLLTRPIPIDLN